MAAAPLVVERTLGRVLHLHVDSAKNLNALSSAMIRALHERFSPRRLETASVVLLTGAGKHFCAGHDLAEMHGGGCSPDFFRQCSELMERIATCEIPVVAAVQGCAFAGGCQLAASCDIVLATRDARFSTPGVKIGLFCSTPSVALTRAVPQKVAAEMLFAARELSAEEALTAGLVSRLLPAGASVAELEAEALRTCRRIAEAPREVLVGGKALLPAQLHQPLGSAYALASEAMTSGLARPCAAEGIGAFLEKRPPCWPTEDCEVAQALALVPGGVAVVGASPEPSRPSFGVFRAIQAEGGPVHPVNPKAPEVLGVPTAPSLEAVSAPTFALVNVFRASGAPAAEAIDGAIAMARAGRGVRGVWLQLGVRAPEAEARARQAGLVCVADRCLSVELRRSKLLQQRQEDGAGAPEMKRAKL